MRMEMEKWCVRQLSRVVGKRKSSQQTEALREDERGNEAAPHGMHNGDVATHIKPCEMSILHRLRKEGGGEGRKIVPPATALVNQEELPYRRVHVWPLCEVLRVLTLRPRGERGAVRKRAARCAVSAVPANTPYRILYSSEVSK